MNFALATGKSSFVSFASLANPVDTVAAGQNVDQPVLGVILITVVESIGISRLIIYPVDLAADQVIVIARCLV